MSFASHIDELYENAKKHSGGKVSVLLKIIGGNIEMGKLQFIVVCALQNILRSCHQSLWKGIEYSLCDFH